MYSSCSHFYALGTFSISRERQCTLSLFMIQIFSFFFHFGRVAICCARLLTYLHACLVLRQIQASAVYSPDSSDLVTWRSEGLLTWAWLFTKIFQMQLLCCFTGSRAGPAGQLMTCNLVKISIVSTWRLYKFF